MKHIKTLLKIEKSCFPTGKNWRENISKYNTSSALNKQNDTEEHPYTRNIYPLDMSYNNKAFLEDPVSKVCLFYGNIFTRG